MSAAKGPDGHSIGSKVPQRWRLALDRLWMTRRQRRWTAIGPCTAIDLCTAMDCEDTATIQCVAEADRAYPP